MTTILYEKDINTMTPNQVLNKVIAHELRHDIKPRAPPSSPTHSALACKQVKKLKKMAIKSSSSEEEEEEACQSSSSDDQKPMNPLPLQASKEDEQMLEGNQLHGVCGLPQRWASPSTYEG